MSTASKNGATLPERVAPLAYMNAKKSPHRRGSINTATTHRRSSSEFDLLLSLARRIEARVRQQSPVQIDTAELEPPQLMVAVAIAFQNVAEWAEAGRHSDSLAARQRFLREARSTHPGRLRQALERLAEEAIARPLAQCRDALARSAETAPFAFDAVACRLREAIVNLNYPPPTGEAFNRLARLIQGYQAFTREAAGLPASARRIAGLIGQRASAEAELALAEIALDYATAALVRGTQRLLAQAEEEAQRAARYRQQLDQFVRAMDARRAAIQQQKALASGSITVELESDDESTLLAALMRRLDAPDAAAFDAALIERQADELRLLASQKYPLLSNRATFCELVSGIDPADVADELARLARRHLGAGQSVYASLRKYGIGRAARELFVAAEVLCDLGARDHAALTVTPAEHLLVRLPRAGGEETQIREDLKTAFESIDKGAMFVEGAPDSEVVVVRTLLGFPAAIDATNDILLAAYSDCGGIHHFPHLFGVLPNSRTGQPIAEVVQLGQRLQHG